MLGPRHTRQQVSATGRSASCQKFPATRRLFGAHTVISYEWGCELVSNSIWLAIWRSTEVYTRYDKAYFANFVAAVSRTNSCLNSCNWSQRQNSVAATMIFRNLTVPHEANYCGDLSLRRVAATYRLVCPGLYRHWQISLFLREKLLSLIISYIISSIMHTIWLVLTFDLLEDRRIADVIIKNS